MKNNKTILFLLENVGSHIVSSIKLQKRLDNNNSYFVQNSNVRLPHKLNIIYFDDPIIGFNIQNTFKENYFNNLYYSLTENNYIKRKIYSSIFPITPC